MINNKLQNTIKKIKLLVSDVDGVLTDGKILISADGMESKFFNVEDGTAAALARYSDIPIALISGRYSECTKIRASELFIKHCFQDTLNKRKPLNDLLNIYSVNSDEVAYIGDSLVDIPVMEIVGYPIAVNNAHQKVKDISIYITQKKGGEGVLLEVIEKILIEQNKYEETLKKMRHDKFDK